MVQVTELYHYPIKGLSPQPTSVLNFTKIGGLPYDRVYALALGTTVFEPKRPQPLDKGHFLMLRANNSLATLQTNFDVKRSILTIRLNAQDLLEANILSAEGRAAAEAFFTDFVDVAARGKIRVLHASWHKFTDVSVVSPVMMRALSVVNLSTIRALESYVGQDIHPLRFGANIYIDGLEAGAELDWVDREIRIGSVRLRGALRTRRCAAIDVNPMTGIRDTHLPKDIVRHFSHPNLGVYLEILEDGKLTVGDKVRQ